MFRRLWERIVGRKTKPHWLNDPTSLGRLLLDNGLVTEEQLAMAHDLKQNADFLIGQALIEHPDIKLDKGVVEAMIVVQRTQRREIGNAEIFDFVSEQSRRNTEAHERLRSLLAAQKLAEDKG